MSLTDKRILLSDALSLVPAKGCTLALGGVTLYRRPMAFALALWARRLAPGAPSDITLLSFTGGPESDLLIGSGLVSRIRSCYIGLEVFGLAPNFTQAAQNGTLKIIEETEASLAFGLRATLAGVGFMPSRAWRGTDLPRLRPDVQSIVDPYSGETLTAFPAVHCDVAVLHALRADPQGNAEIGTHWGVDRELSLVAKTVIITAEEIVPRLTRADLIGPTVTAVVEAPHGAWPTSCHPRYPMDGLAILDYAEQAGTERETALLESWCHRHNTSD
jgi:glutaconate CoA-transferase subunit A